MGDTTSERALRPEALALLRAGGQAYYRDADLGMVRRIGGGALAVITLMAVALLPVSPPTAYASAPVGWAAAAIVVAACAGATVLLLSGSRLVSIEATVALAIGALLAIGVLDTLASPQAPYDKLVVLVLVWASATHTLRRVLCITAIAALVRVPSLVAAGWAPDAAAEALVQIVVWQAIGGLALLHTAGTRAMRARLRREGSHARALARVDQLTGLGNRRAFDEMAAVEVARSARTGRPLSLVVADLDAFKAINDEHGHLAGDDCLRQVAAVVRSAVRRPDACFRWGGDEFALLLPETDLDAAEAVAERLTAAVEETCRAPGGCSITLGVGVAQHDGDETPEALLARADRALLVAKS
ncbi:MAG: GGDEF domain-containing protein [Actinobacteria bacterium]|nr:MAG: GGDEF domain-containing protein [Actinomycetota bacterium]